MSGLGVKPLSFTVSLVSMAGVGRLKSSSPSDQSK
jgi:hypothetical protein